MGLTRSQLARRADVSQRTLESIERGDTCRQSTKRKLLSSLRIPFYRNKEFFPLTALTSAAFERFQERALAVLRTANNYPYRFTIQGLGMLRFYLSKSQRLHIWSPKHAAPNASTLHSHPSAFVSTVLSGSLENHIYTQDPIAEPSDYYGQVLHCGKGGGLVGDRANVRLGLESVALYTIGHRYRMEIPQIHETKPNPGCVTLCDREGVGADYATVYWPLDTKWGDAEPRPATPDEVAEITEHALSVWGE